MLTNKYSLFILGVLLIFFFWGIGHYITPNKIPSFLSVFQDLYLERNTHFKNILITAEIAFKGLLLGFICALIIVLFVAILPSLEFVITPALVVVKATPLIAFIPLIMLVFKLSKLSLIVATALICFYPIVFGGLVGINSVPNKINILADVYYTSRLTRLRYVTWAYILDGILASLKVSAPLSLVGSLVAQFLMGVNYAGLGGYISEHTYPLSIIPKYISIVLSSFLGLIFYTIVYFIHSVFTKYARLRKK